MLRRSWEWRCRGVQGEIHLEELTKRFGEVAAGLEV